ncbi:MAG: hypothetical protein ACR2N7_04990 [Acidimicrobiia bacterium]
MSEQNLRQSLIAPDWRDWQGAFYDAVASGEKDMSPRSRIANAQ